MRRGPARLAMAVAAIIAIGAMAAPAGAAASVIPGNVAINDGSVATNDLQVVVSTPASGATQMRLSNDGLTFTPPMPKVASVDWDLGDTTYGTQGDPARLWVFVWFDDGTETWDPDWLTGDQINWDVTPPTETAMRVSLNPDSTVSSGGMVSHRITWLNTDNVGTQRYDVQERIDGGAWSDVSTTLQLPGLLRAVSAGHSHQFQARGVDYAGNVGAWLLGPTVHVTAYQESSAKVTWTGTWKRVTSSALWGGAAKASSDPGAKARIRFSGQSIALVCRLGPKRGMLVISVDGVKVGTVPLRAAALKARRVVWAKWWPTSGSHTVSVKVQKAPGGSKAEVDAFVVEG